ncbi:aminoglycoside phosphotransferase family protein [Alkalihalophilus lindianensis]|uniref:Aminoglycoside phosphotransferase family protein n=1 Tax=Alkalihalophilus lindianensis TaxID=1630542 RepID=A0ABU3X4G3_9BACI|nr:aminoglycoside phosphotransferase family protein [Alkalihalophilus lindianensis]MDV2682786.1 aminoglycoside phosphotransferase family protein [Alkalihalophilus lindianensis]
MNLGKPFAKGNTAEIYLHQNKIVKVFHDHLPDGESSYEAKKQTYAHSCGLPVPEVYDVSTINGRQAIIMEFVNGRTLGEMLLEDRGQAAHYMELAVDIQRVIHQIVADSFESMAVKLRRKIEFAPQLNTKYKSALLQKLSMLTSKNHLCHGDFHLFNIMMTETNEVMIIDWVDSSAGDILADVYRTYLLYTQYDQELAEMYLRIYCKKSGFTREEIMEWAPIIAGARLSENVSWERNERLMEVVERHCFLK